MVIFVLQLYYTIFYRKIEHGDLICLPLDRRRPQKKAIEEVTLASCWRGKASSEVHRGFRSAKGKEAMASG